MVLKRDKTSNVPFGRQKMVWQVREAAEKTWLLLDLLDKDDE
jgi:hypothetical protein